MPERYINRLQRENRELRAELLETYHELIALRVYLQSEKFTSLNAGDRRFYVNTQDVLDRLPNVYPA